MLLIFGGIWKGYESFCAIAAWTLARNCFRSNGLRRTATAPMRKVRSLSDLGTSFRVIADMNLVPFVRWDLVRLIIMLSLPLLPLLLTVIPLEQMIDRSFKLLL